MKTEKPISQTKQPTVDPAASRRHQFLASSYAVVRLEDGKELDDLRADLLAFYQPVNSQELFAVERIALAQQSMLRAARLESGIFTSSLNEAMNTDGSPIFLMTPEVAEGIDIAVQQNRNYCLSEGLKRVSQDTEMFSLFLRYQAQAERQYRRAVEEFERLRRQRGRHTESMHGEVPPETTAPPSRKPSSDSSAASKPRRPFPSTGARRRSLSQKSVRPARRAKNPSP
jgi:hypothetical protein